MRALAVALLACVIPALTIHTDGSVLRADWHEGGGCYAAPEVPLDRCNQFHPRVQVCDGLRTFPMRWEERERWRQEQG